MFDIKIDGIGEVKQLLNKVKYEIKELEGKKQIPINELFSSSFMKKYTKHNSFANYMQASKLMPAGTKIITNEVLETISDKGFDDYVRGNTIFKSWTEMLQAAAQEYIKEQLGL
jgi:hypothetical protein